VLLLGSSSRDFCSQNLAQRHCQEAWPINDISAPQFSRLHDQKQEQWIYDHWDRLRVPVAVAVGAAFGFLSGRVRRALEWIGNHGLEWRTFN